jgi:hypothetical protein
MIKILIKKLKTLRSHFVKKRCFKVYFTDNKSGREGKINVWVKDVDEVESYFEKHFPHLELYDIGEVSKPHKNKLR